MAASSVTILSPEKAAATYVAKPSRALLQVGDSLTENQGTGTNSAAIKTAFGSATVTNIGKGGQTAAQVAARQGGAPALVTVAGGIIPGSGGVTVTVEVNLLQINSTSGSWSIDGVLAGIPGTLSMVKTSGTYAYTFTRKAAGNAIPVGAGIPFATGHAYRDRIMVICVGRNGFSYPEPNRDSPEKIVDLIRQMIAWSTRNPDDHLVFSIPPTTEETPGTANRILLDAANAAIRKAFQRNWVDAAAYLRSEVTLRSAGITPTAQDTTDIGNSVTPTSFRGAGDLLHYNAAAYVALGVLTLREFASRSTITWSEPIVDTGTPTPTPTMHGYGLTTASHRYIGAQLPAVDALATPWPDAIGSLSLALATTNLKVATGPAGVDKAVVTSGVAQSANTQRIFNTTGAPEVRTLAVLLNNVTPATSAFTFASAANPGLSVLRGASGALVARLGSAQAVAPLGGAEAAGWKVVFAIYDDVAGTVTLDADGTSVTATGAVATTSSATFMVGGSEAAATDVRIAEVLTFPTALSVADRASVRSALKAHYPAIA